MASITQMFYATNFFHDWFYDSGFDEVSGNAQASNLGRGGKQNDRLRAEAQDGDGTVNNANILVPSDGGAPRIQMYVFTRPPEQLAHLTVNSPEPLTGAGKVGIAGFGAQQFDLTGEVVLGSDLDAPTCEQLSPVAGKIALIDRMPGCQFNLRVYKAELAGAIGVLMANNIPNAPVVNMVGDQ